MSSEHFTFFFDQGMLPVMYIQNGGLSFLGCNPANIVGNVMEWWHVCMMHMSHVLVIDECVVVPINSMVWSHVLPGNKLLYVCCASKCKYS